MQQALLVGVLLLMIGAASVVLSLDARQRRIDRRVEKALSRSHSYALPSIRRSPTGSRWLLLHRLANYHEGISYDFGPKAVLLAVSVAVTAVFYANSLAGYPLLYVFFAAFLVAIVMVRGLFGWQRHRFVDRLFRQLPDTIEMVTSAVRSGLPVNEAFRTLAHEMPQPTAGQFAIVCSEMALGKPVHEAVEGVYRRTGLPEYGFFAVTLAVQIKAGGGLAETLQTLADTVRQRVAMAARAKALSGEVIFSARALSVAPLLVGGLLYTISPAMMEVFFHDPTGKKLLAYAAASVLAGNLVMRWMIQKDASL